MTKDKIQAYQYRISQSSKTGLLVILYDMAIDYFDEAIAFNGADYKVTREALVKANRVIDQLIKGLDFNYEISNNLFSIYIYIKKSIVSLKEHFNEKEAKAIIDMLSKLRESFYIVSKQDKTGPVMKNTETVYSGLTYSSRGYGNETSRDPLSNTRGFKA